MSATGPGKSRVLSGFQKSNKKDERGGRAGTKDARQQTDDAIVLQSGCGRVWGLTETWPPRWLLIHIDPLRKTLEGGDGRRQQCGREGLLIDEVMVVLGNVGCQECCRGPHDRGEKIDGSGSGLKENHNGVIYNL